MNRLILIVESTLTTPMNFYIPIGPLI